MSKISIVLFFIFLQLFIVHKIYSQSIVRDSIHLNEIIVTGSRTETNLRNLPMSITVVGNRQIQNRLEQSLLPIITEEVPGLFITGRSIMGYGVAAGSAGGMKIRGVGDSPTTGILMLIDGHPQYMGLMGHPLADSYQSMMAERVEVVRGPASVLYGSNAMGGVINIITKKQLQSGVKTHFRSMYGSYNTSSTEANNAVRSGKFSSYVSLGYNRSDGHRENMDFEQFSGYTKLGYDFTSNWNVFADLNLTNFKVSNPGSITELLIDNDADVTRGMTSFSLENRYNKTSGAVKFFYNFGAHKINDGYNPNKEGSAPLDYRFRSNDNMLGVSIYQTYSFFQGNQATAGFDFQRFSGHAWNTYFDERGDKDIVDKGINNVAGYVNIEQRLSNKLILNAGIRADNNSHAGMAWIPQVGLNYLVSDITSLKAIVSKGFRNPTIREMYMFPPQNPDLKQERLMNYELSVSQHLLNYRLSMELNLFYIKGENSIQTIMVDGKPLNVNTGKIKNHGLEFATHYKMNNNLRFSANYSWLKMKYKVIAAPEQKLYMSADYTRKKWGISSGVQYIGNLYTAVTPTESVKNSFVLWNTRVMYRPTKALEIFGRGENLLAQKYEINKGYPMPRATVFGGINLSF